MNETMQRLAGVLPREAGPQVERKLRAAFRARQRSQKQMWFSIAAAAIFLLSLSFLPAPAPREPVYFAQGFLALPYAQSGVPLESVVVMRVRMRPAELIAMGVAVPAAAWPAKITADVLIGQDGVVRAVRLVQ